MYLHDATLCFKTLKVVAIAHRVQSELQSRIDSWCSSQCSSCPVSCPIRELFLMNGLNGDQRSIHAVFQGDVGEPFQSLKEWTILSMVHLTYNLYSE